MMMAMPRSPSIEITSQQSSLVSSLQARFLLLIREHAITQIVACTMVKHYKCIPLPGQPPVFGSGSGTCFNARTEIHVTLISLQPHGSHSRADTSPCPYGHVSLPMQAVCEPFRRSFVQRYGVDMHVNHALQTVPLSL
jgi:hypothetical protein